MAAITAHAHLEVQDDDMEISSDAGRDEFRDNDIDIDIDFGDEPDVAYTDDSMIDDDAEAVSQNFFSNYATFQGDDMVVEEGVVQDTTVEQYEDNSSHHDIVDEDLADIDLDDDGQSDIEIIGDNHGDDLGISRIEEDGTEQYLAIPHDADYAAALPSDTSVVEAAVTQGETTDAPEQHDIYNGESIANSSSTTREIVNTISAHAAINRGAEINDSVLQAHDPTEQTSHQYAGSPVTRTSVFLDESKSLGTAGSAHVAEELAEAREHTLARQDAAFTADVAPSMHQVVLAVEEGKCPVSVTFRGWVFDQHPLEQEMDRAMSEDKSLVNKKLQEFLAFCRSALGDRITDDEQLTIRIDQLRLSLDEDCNQTSDFTLNEVTEVYAQLCENDGSEVVEPLSLILERKTRFTAWMMNLSTQANAGHGLFHVVSQAFSSESDSEIADYDAQFPLDDDDAVPLDAPSEELDGGEKASHEANEVVDPSVAVTHLPHNIEVVADVRRSSPEPFAYQHSVLGVLDASLSENTGAEEEDEIANIAGTVDSLTKTDLSSESFQAHNSAEQDDAQEDLLDFGEDEDEEEQYEEAQEPDLDFAAGAEDEDDAVASPPGITGSEGDAYFQPVDYIGLHAPNADQDEVDAVPEAVPSDDAEATDYPEDAHDVAEDNIEFPEDDENYDESLVKITDTLNVPHQPETVDILQLQSHKEDLNTVHIEPKTGTCEHPQTQLASHTQLNADLVANAAFTGRKRSRGAGADVDDESDGSTKKARA